MDGRSLADNLGGEKGSSQSNKRKLPQTLHVITATAMKMVWDEL